MSHFVHETRREYYTDSLNLFSELEAKLSNNNDERRALLERFESVNDPIKTTEKTLPKHKYVTCKKKRVKYTAEQNVYLLFICSRISICSL